MNNSDKKKPLLSGALTGDDNKGFASANADEHNDRITRFATLKHRAKNQENYLFSLAQFKDNYEKDVKNEESIKALKSAQKLNECGNYLLFKNFYTIGEVKLSKLRTCGQHLLCPFCAAIRASRAIQKYVERINQVLQENRKLKPVLITLTVKNGSDLAERSEHLMKSFRTLLERRRDYLKRVGVIASSVRFKGPCTLTRIHTTKKQVSGIRIFICLHWLISGLISRNFQNIGIALLGTRWLLTSAGREKEKGHGYSKAAAEVCKYALKFGDLSVEKTWEAFKVLKGKRLTGSFGLLWGVKIPETMTDDMPDDETLPYMEMLYKFVYGKKSHYDLAITRMVEPKARERAEEKEATTTTYERDIAGGSITNDVRTLPVRGLAVTERPQRGRKTSLESFTFYPCSGSATNPKMGRIFI